MFEYRNLEFSQHNGIGVLTIARPQVLNALDLTTLEELQDFIAKISISKTVKVLIITGSGERAFIAGADINSMKNMTALEARAWAKFGQSVFNALEELPQPVIAAINGVALGGGCELAMSCDIRIAVDQAKFGQPEVALGVIPGFGGTQRLARLVGRGVAKEMLLTGASISAQEAYRIGLVNKVVPVNELLPAAEELAHKIVAQGAIAVSLCKAAVNRGLDMDLASGQAYEAELFGLCFATADQKIGMNAFVKKTKAEFVGT